MCFFFVLSNEFESDLSFVWMGVRRGEVVAAAEMDKAATAVGAGVDCDGCGGG